MSKIQFCPRCGQKTAEPVCPICFTRLQPPQVQQPQQPQLRGLTDAEKAAFPPFTCPRCGKNELCTDGVSYFCAGCGVRLVPPQRMFDPVTENPDFIENPAAKQPDPQQTVDFTPLKPPVQVKKRGLTRGGLIAILCSIVLLFTVGGGIAIAADGIVERQNVFEEMFEDPFAGFGDGFFSDLPGFEDYFGSTDPFEENSLPESDLPQDDPFAEQDAYEWKTGEAIPDADFYPNGCDEDEYLSLKAGMTYAQISAIIGGDAGNWYETTDNGTDCMVFQWITEDSRGIVSVKMVDGKAEEFHVENYPD